MSSTFAVAAAASSRPVARGFARAAFVGIAALGLLAASCRSAPAQSETEQKPTWEFLVSSGTVVPTGVQRDDIKRGNLTAAQLYYVMRPELALTATLGWARSRDVASADNPKLDVFTYDVGAEVRAPEWIAGESVTFSPFAGIGGGARSYNYRSLRVDATHNLAAYGSVGGELAIGRFRLRFEARDYVTGFKPLDGRGDARTGNDVAILAGLRILTR